MDIYTVIQYEFDNVDSIIAAFENEDEANKLCSKLNDILKEIFSSLEKAKESNDRDLKYYFAYYAKIISTQSSEFLKKWSIYFDDYMFTSFQVRTISYFAKNES
jgi:hypothetical protein